MKIKRISKGRYGTLSIASIPKIANGAGSVTDFKLKIDKKSPTKARNRASSRPNARTGGC